MAQLPKAVARRNQNFRDRHFVPDASAALVAELGKRCVFFPASRRVEPELDRMAMSAEELESLLREAFADAEIVIQDLAGDGDHYRAVIRSGAFAGKSRVAQHQMVYAALKGRMGGQLHALALDTGPKS
jgi:stress-induced morphogen